MTTKANLHFMGGIVGPTSEQISIGSSMKFCGDGVQYTSGDPILYVAVVLVVEEVSA